MAWINGGHLPLINLKKLGDELLATLNKESTLFMKMKVQNYLLIN